MENSKTRLDGEDLAHLLRIREAERAGFKPATMLLNAREVGIDWNRLLAFEADHRRSAHEPASG